MRTLAQPHRLIPARRGARSCGRHTLALIQLQLMSRTAPRTMLVLWRCPCKAGALLRVWLRLLELVRNGEQSHAILHAQHLSFPGLGRTRDFFEHLSHTSTFVSSDMASYAALEWQSHCMCNHSIKRTRRARRLNTRLGHSLCVLTPLACSAGHRGDAANSAAAAAPHMGVYPIVTPPDWDSEVTPRELKVRKPRAAHWLLDVPLKGIATGARTSSDLVRSFRALNSAITRLTAEGWQLDGVVNGTLHLSVVREQDTEQVKAADKWLTKAFGFGVMPEIRTVPRAPVGGFAASVRCSPCACVPDALPAAISSTELCCRKSTCTRVLSCRLGLCLVRNAPKLPVCAQT